MNQVSVECGRCPHGWTHVESGHLHLLVCRPPDDPLLLRLREVAGLDDMLDVLVSGGIRALPDFVAVHAGERRVVARGAGYADVRGPGPSGLIRTAPRETWADVVLDVSVERVVLFAESMDSYGGHAPVPVPTGEAQVQPPTGQPVCEASGASTPENARASSVRSNGEDGAGPESAADLGGTSAIELTGPPPSYDHLFGATQHGRPKLPGASAADPDAEPHERALDAPNADETAGSDPPVPVAEPAGRAAPQPPNAEHTLPPPANTQSVPESPPGPGGSPAPPAGASPARPSRTSTPGVPQLIDSVPWRAQGATPPAPPSRPAPSSAVSGRRMPPPPPVDAVARAARTVVPPAPAAGPGKATGHASREPSAASAAENPLGTGVRSQAGEDLDPDKTVDRSALRAQLAAGGPSILGVLCPQGHANPAHQSRCRVCRAEVPQQEPSRVPRPPLGVLRLSGGDLVTLDRGVLMGRAPTLSQDLPPSERPHLLRLPSPENDLSRNHVEVLLDGWLVLVRDLGSTNGTTITLPGTGPVRLNPHDQQVLEPETVVTLADVVSFTYEVEP